MPPRKCNIEPRRSARNPKHSKDSIDGISSKRQKIFSKPPNLEWPLIQKKSIDGRDIDCFCWICHQSGQQEICSMCPRVYHSSCLSQKSLEFTSSGICPECLDASHPLILDKRQSLKDLLKYALQQAVKEDTKRNNLKSLKAITSQNSRYVRFFKTWPDIENNKVLCKIVDLEYLIDKMNDDQPYEATAAFFSDVKWIYHNCYILYGADSEQTEAALKLERNFKREMTDIEACSECYERMHSSDSLIGLASSFSQVCCKPHAIVWAKLRGSPYWPAKCLKIENGHADVRFFGTHDKARLALSQCFKLSQKSPNEKEIKQVKYREALSELSAYINNYKVSFTSFPYAPFRTPLLDSNSKFIKKHQRRSRQRICGLGVHTSELLAQSDIDPSEVAEMSHPISNVHTSTSTFTEEPSELNQPQIVSENLTSAADDIFHPNVDLPSQQDPLVHMTFSADETCESDMPRISDPCGAESFQGSCDVGTTPVLSGINRHESQNSQSFQEQPAVNVSPLPVSSNALTSNILYGLLMNSPSDTSNAFKDVFNSFNLDTGSIPVFSGPNIQSPGISNATPPNINNTGFSTKANMNDAFQPTPGCSKDSDEVQCIGTYRPTHEENIEKARKFLPALSSIIMSYWPESSEECLEQGFKLLQLWSYKMWTYLVLNLPKGNNTSRFAELYKHGMIENNKLTFEMENMKNENRRYRRQIYYYHRQEKTRFKNMKLILKAVKDKDEATISQKMQLLMEREEAIGIKELQLEEQKQVLEEQKLLLAEQKQELEQRKCKLLNLEQEPELDETQHNLLSSELALSQKNQAFEEQYREIERELRLQFEEREAKREQEMKLNMERGIQEAVFQKELEMEKCKEEAVAQKELEMKGYIEEAVAQKELEMKWLNQVDIAQKEGKLEQRIQEAVAQKELEMVAQKKLEIDRYVQEATAQKELELEGRIQEAVNQSEPVIKARLEAEMRLCREALCSSYSQTHSSRLLSFDESAQTQPRLFQRSRPTQTTLLLSTTDTQTEARSCDLEVACQMEKDSYCLNCMKPATIERSSKYCSDACFSTIQQRLSNSCPSNQGTIMTLCPLTPYYAIPPQLPFTSTVVQSTSIQSEIVYYEEREVISQENNSPDACSDLDAAEDEEDAGEGNNAALEELPVPPRPTKKLKRAASSSASSRAAPKPKRRRKKTR